MITRERAYQLRRMITKAAVSLSDEDALISVELFDPWEPDTAYAVDDRRREGMTLYKCVQAHTSQAGWEPSKTPALWTEVSLDEWPEWKQPIGAQDAYRVGDKVSHNEKHWICASDYNVYEPGIYGWDLAD